MTSCHAATDRGGFASKVYLRRLCRLMCGEAEPRRWRSFRIEGFALGSGHAPILWARGRTNGTARLFNSTNGEAKPRRTSGGVAAPKRLLRQSFETEV